MRRWEVQGGHQPFHGKWQTEVKIGSNRVSLRIRFGSTEQSRNQLSKTLRGKVVPVGTQVTAVPYALLFSEAYLPWGQNYCCQRAENGWSSRIHQSCKFSVEWGWGERVETIQLRSRSGHRHPDTCPRCKAPLSHTYMYRMEVGHET